MSFSAHRVREYVVLLCLVTGGVNLDHWLEVVLPKFLHIKL